MKADKEETAKFIETFLSNNNIELNLKRLDFDIVRDLLKEFTEYQMNDYKNRLFAGIELLDLEIEQEKAVNAVIRDNFVSQY